MIGIFKMTIANELGKSTEKFNLKPKKNHDLKLGNGSSIAVIGGGPAGSFFTIFLLDYAKMAEIKRFK